MVEAGRIMETGLAVVKELDVIFSPSFWSPWCLIQLQERPYEDNSETETLLALKARVGQDARKRPQFKGIRHLRVRIFRAQRVSPANMVQSAPIAIIRVKIVPQDGTEICQGVCSLSFLSVRC